MIKQLKDNDQSANLSLAGHYMTKKDVQTSFLPTKIPKPIVAPKPKPKDALKPRINAACDSPKQMPDSHDTSNPSSVDSSKTLPCRTKLQIPSPTGLTSSEG